MPEASALARATVALALTLGLSGCSSDDKKPQTLPTLKSPTASTSSTPSPSGLPDATVESVKAFVKSYYDEINRAISTGDVTKLATYSIPACPCRRLVTSIKEKSAGSSIRGGRFTLKSVAPHDVTPTLAGAQVLYDVEKAEVVKSDGRVIETIEAAPGARDDISIVRSGGGWLVSNVLILK